VSIATLLITATTLSSLSAETADQKAKTVSSQAGIVATLGDQTITNAQLEELAKDRLMRLRSEEYQIKRQVLEEYVTRALIEKEARARGVSVEQLQKSEIDDKVMPVTEDQKRAVFESTPRQQFAGKSEAEAFAQIEANLNRIRVSESRGKFMSALRRQTPVTILLEPPRVALNAGENPVLGPADAPVTVVEFSDFQCPACGHAFPTIKRLMQQYNGKVRLVFHDFPLPMHPQAPKAAEAAACAREQGKFWEMHDRMFANQQKLAISDLKAAASELGMDAAKFGSCLDSGMYAVQVQNNVAEGRKYGVSATPTFFINGRMLSGSAAYQTFSSIIDEELSRASNGSKD
jgi:protein-disulfide isomerase